jgi:hypothetical protein
MLPILISCPDSGALVPTGAHADRPDDSLDDLPEENLLSGCPDCGSDHRWTRADAIVAPG